MKNNSEDSDEMSQSKGKNSTTITLLSFTIVLLICLIGYEVIKDSFSPTIYAEKKTKSKKPYQILSDDKKLNRQTSSSYPFKKTIQPGVKNRPYNQQKNEIPEIEKSIIANEMLHSRAHSTIRNLEKELGDSHKKIESLDYALDTLTYKIELARAEKAKLEEQFLTQIKSIEETSQTEKETLNQSLTESISQNLLLKKTIDEKVANLQELTNLLTEQKNQLRQQSQEIEEITNQLENVKSSNNLKIAELTNQIDNEKAQNLTLKEELSKTENDLSEAYENIKDFEAALTHAAQNELHFQSTLDQMQILVSMKDLEMNNLINSYSDIKKEMTKEIQDLVFFLNWEKSHSHKIHHQLQLSVKKYETEKMQVNQLQMELENTLEKAKEAQQRVAIQNELNSIQQLEIGSLLGTFNAYKMESKESLNNLLDFYETEKIVVKNTLEKLTEEQKKYAILAETSSNRQLEFTKQLIDLTNKENSMTEYLQGLKDELEDEKKRGDKFQHHAQFLSKKINQEKNTALQLQDLLLVSVEKALDLEGELFNEKEKVVFLETQLGNHLTRIMDKENEFNATTNELNKALQAQKDKMDKIRVSFDETLHKYSSELSRNKTLEELASKYENKLYFHENQSKQLEETIQDLKTSLKMEEEHSQEISSALQEAFSRQYSNEQKTCELSNLVEGLQASNIEKEKKLERLIHEIEEEKDYSETLFFTTSKLQNYVVDIETSLKQKTDKLLEVESLFTTYKNEGSAKEKELQKMVEQYANTNVELSNEIDGLKRALNEEKSLSAKLIQSKESEEFLEEALSSVPKV